MRTLRFTLVLHLPIQEGLECIRVYLSIRNSRPQVAAEADTSLPRRSLARVGRGANFSGLRSRISPSQLMSQAFV